jgi:signal transduction histidine kinase
MARNPLSPAQRLLAVFVFTIFAPGLLLAIFGGRALWQERRLADQQLRDRLDHGTDLAVRTLADEITRLQSIVDAGSPAAESSFRALPQNGSWAYVERRDSALHVYPTNILPYELAESTESLAVNPELQRIAEAKHRQAISLRNAGSTADAMRLWRELASAGGRIGSLPAGLVAGFELSAFDHAAATDFYRNLLDGRWRLEKARYLYYLSEIRKRLGLKDESDNRLRLAEAVEVAASSSRRSFHIEDTAYFVFRRDAPFAALVVSSEFLKALLLPKIVDPTGSDVRVLKIDANGEALYARSPAANGLQTVRAADASGLSWKIEAEPLDAAGFYAATNRRTTLYTAMLSLVVLSLASGGYFMARTVRRELEVARMKSEFVSTVSHEFRSPLTGIRQLGEMLARDRITDDSKRHQYYQLIVRESDRLGRLVENVLDFSRMEAGRKQYRFEPLDTAAWLSGVAEDFQAEASRSGHQLQTNISTDLPSIVGDREALSTAVRNLLDNACKYSPESQSVWLDAAVSNGGVCVSVRDRGVGIAAHDQRQIFEKFYRGGALAKHVKGAGLGLSLVQHIVAAHQGEVHVESREGEGSTFLVYLKGAS